VVWYAPLVPAALKPRRVVQDAYVRAFGALGTFREEAALGSC
jgi:hypothetical protein